MTTQENGQKHPDQPRLGEEDLRRLIGNEDHLDLVKRKTTAFSRVRNLQWFSAMGDMYRGFQAIFFAATYSSLCCLCKPNNDFGSDLLVAHISTFTSQNWQTAPKS